VERSGKYLDAEMAASIASSFRKPGRKLILLDYDGTLVPFRCEPSAALPDTDLMKLLHKISGIKKLDLVIISGRNREFLEQIFIDLKATLFAEHGAIYRIDGKWESLDNDTSWKEEISVIMQQFVDTTPGTNIEIKQNSLVWHFRKADNESAEKNAVLLINRLVPFCSSNNLTIMKGRKIIEVKPSDYTKGTAIIHFFDCSEYDFILAAGDDVTDEDLFESLPGNAIKIHIGRISEISDYSLRNSFEFVDFLKSLVTT
jgi:trehalose 6-phosphate synthase/phosphatase